MITKNELITFIYNSKTINATLNKITSDYRDDFKQHFFEELLKKDFDKLLEIHSQCDSCLEAYAGGIIRNQLKSNKSSFHYQYRKNATDSDENLPVHYDHFTNDVRYQDDLSDEEIYLQQEKAYTRIIDFLRHLHPKKALLFIEHYVNGKSIPEISKQYSIKYRTVHHSIRLTEQLIRDNIKFEL